MVNVVTWANALVLQTTENANIKIVSRICLTDDANESVIMVSSILKGYLSDFAAQ